MLVLAAILAAQNRQANSVNALADSAERKFRHIEQNGARAQPDPKPTVLTEDEINAYIAAGRLKLPTGVKSARLHGEAGVITSVSRVDFDEITAGRRSANPLLYLFTGEHDVETKARAGGRGGEAVVEVEWVKLDGMEIPRTALEFFIDRFLRAKHPEIGTTTRFKMPHRIESAVVGDKTLTITQR
jgi:hypothetical protein